MEVKKIVPPITGFLQVVLDKEIIDYLWKIIDNSASIKEDYKPKLAGNINESYALVDENEFFYRNVLIKLVQAFRQTDPTGLDPILQQYSPIKPGTKLVLSEFWVNFQNKTDFNPFHFHGGVYSFAIWMKIPYDWKEQIKLPQFKGINKDYKKAGCFDFEYIDSLGSIRNFTYKLDPTYDGQMVFFPASLRHSVYPFYDINDQRVSISGNLWYEHTSDS